MNLPRLGFLLFVTSMACAFQAVPAQAKTGSEQMEVFLTGLETLRAGFVQSAGETAGADIRGTFWIKRPGRFRWEYSGNETQLIVADGDRVWLIDGELDQVSFQSQERALRGTPALLLSGTGPVDEHFDLRDSGSSGGLEWVLLRPKDEEGQFQEIRLGFSEDQLWIIRMTDGLGQITQLRFFGIERNPDLDPELFRYRPPIGADLIGDF